MYDYQSRGYADQLNIETPEQVDLRFPIAGIGSRFLAILTDSVIQIIVFWLTIFVFALVVSAAPHVGGSTAFVNTGAKWFVAVVFLFYFLLYWGYFSLFEAFWNGQTPGKRLLKIRVIKDSGRQITLFEALARNLIRVIDALPSVYLVGVITMLCNREQKRLGDLVAGTIVVHERSTEQPLLAHNSRTFTASLYPQPLETPREPATPLVPADGIARLDAGDLNIIDTFFSRALDLDLDKRAEIAGRIAQRMSAKMQVPLPADQAPERVLESIAHAMRAQSGR
ncbi:MAG: RDD family protein [Edaphobacter sp.]